jgi:hypothetical protein
MIENLRTSRRPIGQQGLPKGSEVRFSIGQRGGESLFRATFSLGIFPLPARARHAHRALAAAFY